MHQNRLEAGKSTAKVRITRFTTRRAVGHVAEDATVGPMATKTSSPQAGDKAPNIALQDQHGDTVRLSGFKGRKVLVFFYPKALTPGCTQQACGLRDIAGDVGETAIVGISPDEPKKQAQFDEKHGLGFTLLSDPEHTVAEAYGVWGEKSVYGRKYMGIIRSAFLIDEKGKIEAAWPKISPKDTPKNLLAALKS